jgi:superfamily I DNA/RNA helicase
MRYKVVGPPGTGKTKTLLDKVKLYLDTGISLDRIGYFAFTKKASEEARDRFLALRPNLTKQDIKYFQTLHSLAFNNLGLKEENVMDELNYKVIGETSGIQIKYAFYEKNAWNGIFTSDSEYLTLINLARVKRIKPLEQLDLNEHLGKVERDKLEALDIAINQYKKVYELIDFTDMLEKFLEKGSIQNKLDVIFIDEAQDLSKIQWAMIEKIERDNGCDVWVAGDDDQAIFGWAGADVESFIDWDATEMPLKQSERVPSVIQQKALSVISRVDNRLDKDYLPKKEPGQLFEVFDFLQIDMSKGDWLILARTNPLLKAIPVILKMKGLFFETKDGQSISKKFYDDILNWDKFKKGQDIPEVQQQRLLERIKGKPNLSLQWFDAFTNVSQTKIDYVQAMLDNNEKLDQEPRIKVSTIHSAKGGEATNVVLFLNQTINTMRATKKSISKQDEEYRVWYVGVTRTIQNLYLIKCKNKQKEFII